MIRLQLPDEYPFLIVELCRVFLAACLIPPLSQGLLSRRTRFFKKVVFRHPLLISLSPLVLRACGLFHVIRSFIEQFLADLTPFLPPKCPSSATPPPTHLVFSVRILMKQLHPEKRSHRRPPPSPRNQRDPLLPSSPISCLPPFLALPSSSIGLP